MCNVGFVREQKAFWAQQSGAVRQRYTALETFGDEAKYDVDNHTFKDAANNDPNRLRSAIAFDHDQWGQVLRFDEIGEASSSFDWKQATASSANALITYAKRQGTAGLGGTGYPMLDLPQSIQVFRGAWPEGESGPPLRAREAIYTDPDDGHGNVTDICLYPGGGGFEFVPGMCAAFKKNLSDALQDGYSTIESALRSAYANTQGLPKGVSDFSAIMHHQFVHYDEFGNLTHAVSPLSYNKEWVERRFSFDEDPFRRTATSTATTRCVQDAPGVGTDSANVESKLDHGCTFGFETLPAAVQRRAITHASQNHIDEHFGVVAETTDINKNSILYDFDRWGRLRSLARNWGSAPRENETFQDSLKLAVAKVDGAAKPDKPLNSPAAFKDWIASLPHVNQWRLLALADYEQLYQQPKDGAQVVDGVLRSNVRRFEPSDSYSGLLVKDETTRETANFSDGLGRAIQSIREADVCLNAKPDLTDGGVNAVSTAELADRCSSTATGIVSPASSIDGLGREWESFEVLCNSTSTKGARFTSAELSRPERKRNSLLESHAGSLPGQASAGFEYNIRWRRPAASGSVAAGRNGDRRS